MAHFSLQSLELIMPAAVEPTSADSPNQSFQDIIQSLKRQRRPEGLEALCPVPVFDLSSLKQAFSKPPLSQDEVETLVIVSKAISAWGLSLSPLKSWVGGWLLICGAPPERHKASNSRDVRLLVILSPALAIALNAIRAFHLQPVDLQKRLQEQEWTSFAKRN